MKRPKLLRRKQFMNRRAPLDTTDAYLKEYYRFERRDIMIIARISPYLRVKRVKLDGVDEVNKVLLTRRFLSSGTFQNGTGQQYTLSQPSMSRMIARVVDILYRLAIQEVKMPSNVHEVNVARYMVDIVSLMLFLNC